MVNRRSRQIPKKDWTWIVCLLILVVVILLSVKTTWTMTEHFLDGDASSDLLLAWRLSKSGELMTYDWIYSTEIHVLHTQVIQALFFHFFSDWHMVRFLSALVMQGILLLSCLYFCRAAGANRERSLLTGALLLMPVSVAYGRIVLYHGMYMPAVTESFLMAGLFLSYEKGDEDGYLRNGLRLLLMAAISFLTGLTGIRQVVCTQFPIVLLLFLRLYREGNRDGILMAVQRNSRGIAAAILLFLAFLPGYYINSRVFTRTYDFMHYSVRFRMPEVAELKSLFYGILHNLGYRTSPQLFSLAGIMTALGLCTGVFFLASAVRSFTERELPAAMGNCFAELFVFCSLLSLCGVALFTTVHDIDFTRHLLPAMSFSAPFFVFGFMEEDSAWHPPMQRVAAFICTVFLFCNGLFNMGYFNGLSTVFNQKYEGLYDRAGLVSDLSGAVAAIREYGADTGYSYRWECNTVTEMTDGELTVVPIEMSTDHSSIHFDKWLTFWSYFELEPERAFLLMPSYMATYFEKIPELFPYGELLYADALYTVYGFGNGTLLRSYFSEHTSW